MTTKEIKVEINKAINEIPENLLTEVLHFLKEIKNYSHGDIELSKNLNKILNEDNELLQKLAK